MSNTDKPENEKPTIAGFELEDGTVAYYSVDDEPSDKPAPNVVGIELEDGSIAYYGLDGEE